MAPTAAEQLMLELVNRARMDPAAEAARHGINLNSGLSYGTISNKAKQPLAWNADLQEAAEAHSKWMIAADIFSHTGAGGSSVGDRVSDAGYDWWTVGENISWRGSTGSMDFNQAIVLQHESLFKSAGHRQNILNENFAEIGIAQEFGKFEIYSSSSMVTQNFGDRRGDPEFLLGVVIDDRDNDDFYDIGEGLGGVTVKAQGNAGTFTTVTYDAGGYQLEVPPGSYTVTFSGGGLGGTVTRNVTIGEDNVKLDVETDDAGSGGGGSSGGGGGSGSGDSGGSGGGGSSPDLFDAWLVDADTEQVLGSIADGAVIQVSNLAARDLTVLVKTDSGNSNAGRVESVRFDLNEGAVNRVESAEPYALFGDRGASNLHGGDGLDAGSHSLDLTGYSSDYGSGSRLGTTTLDFTLKDSGGASSGGSTGGSGGGSDFTVWMVDSRTEQVLAELTDGARLDAGLVDGRSLTFLAEADDGRTDSIVFDFNGGAVERVESHEPYALFGDRGPGNLYGGVALGEGRHRLDLEAWSDNGGRGTLLAEDSFQFDLV